MEMGKFIVVEGLEGSGKSTAIQTIKQHVETFIPEVITTREPGGTFLGETIRNIIKGTTHHENLDPRSELLLLYAARVQLVEEIIKPALARGAWVISDRFELSSFAYQGGGRQIDLNIISFVSSFCLNQFKPDLIFFLDIDPYEGLQRVKNRGKVDRIEEESLSFFNQVKDYYHMIIPTLDNVVQIDAHLPIVHVQEVLIKHLDCLFKDHA